jgi:alkylation response protein AidB-like acyl-CoA dehydrogenase
VEGGVQISGEKTWTTWLPALRAAQVTASVGSGAIGNYVIDLTTSGVERLPGFDALGMRGSASGRLVLNDVFVPADRLIGVREPGRPDPRGPAPGAWFGAAIAAVYLGVGEGARRDVTRWAIDRRPGDGSTAVADLPTIGVRLGRIDAALRSARIVLEDVARRWQDASPVGRAGLVDEVGLAKITATNAAVLATDEALRIAGGPGFLAGRIERAFRDARGGLINPPLDDIAYQGFARRLVDDERSRTRR